MRLLARDPAYAARCYGAVRKDVLAAFLSTASEVYFSIELKNEIKYAELRAYFTVGEQEETVADLILQEETLFQPTIIEQTHDIYCGACCNT